AERDAGTTHHMPDTVTRPPGGRSPVPRGTVPPQSHTPHRDPAESHGPAGTCDQSATQPSPYRRYLHNLVVAKLKRTDARQPLDPAGDIESQVRRFDPRRLDRRGRLVRVRGDPCARRRRMAAGKGP